MNNFTRLALASTGLFFLGAAHSIERPASIPQTAFPDTLGVFAGGVWQLDRNANRAFEAGLETSGWGSPGNVPVVGDWNGDGLDDLGVFAGGAWFIDRNGDGAFDAATEIKGWGAAGWTPMPGDWNGDGVTDLGIVAPGSVWFRDLNGDFAFDPTTEILGWGSAGDTPLVADWDGDGADEVAVFSGGIWFIDFNGDGAWDPVTEIKGWGLAGWTPTPGDWNGDGVTDLGIVAPDSTWFRDMDGDFGFDPATEILGWGSPGTTPIVADWNGDGRSDPGVRSGSYWFLDFNGDGAWDPSEVAAGFGQAADQPIVGRWGAPEPPPGLLDPPYGATDVATNRRILVSLPGPADPASVDDKSVKLKLGAATIPAALVLSTDNRFLSIRPEGPLAAFSNYQLTLNGLMKPGGGLLLGPVISRFQTSAGPDLTEIVSDGGATSGPGPSATPINASLYVELTPRVDPTTFDPTGWAVREETTGTSMPLNCTLNANWSTVSCELTEPLWVGALHKIAGPALETLSGRPLKNPELDFWGLVAGFEEDHTPPQLLAITPPDGTTAYPYSEEIRVYFDEHVNWIGPDTKIAVESNGLPVPIRVQWDPHDPAPQLRLDPVEHLLPGTNYTVILENVRDMAGNNFAGPATSNFTTNTAGFQSASGNITPPHDSVLAKRPVFRVTFNRPVVAGTFTPDRLYLTGPRGRVDATLAVTGYNEATLTPTQDLVSDSTYQLVAGPGLLNIDGWSFRATADYVTADFTDTIPPSVVIISPADGATGVPSTTPLYIKMSEAIDPASVNQQTARLMPGERQLELVGTDILQVSNGGSLSGNSVELNGIRDLAGNMMPRFVSTFDRNTSGTVTGGPILQSATPASGASGVGLDQKITLAFDKVISSLTLNSNTLRLLAMIDGVFETVPAQLNIIGTNVEITPIPALLPNTAYRVEGKFVSGVDPNGLRGYLGLVSPFDPVAFSTGAGPMDETAPQVVSINPADGATRTVNIDRFTGMAVEVTFSEAVNPSTLSLETIFFQYNGKEGFVDTIRTLDNARKVIFRVSGRQDLAAGAMTVIVSNGVKDVAGNRLAADFISQFTLADTKDADEPYSSDFWIRESRPRDNAANMPAGTPISLMMNRPFLNTNLAETLYVTVNGRLVDGVIESLGLDRILRFTPNQSFQPGDNVQFIPRPEWVGVGTGESVNNAFFPLSFDVAPDPATQAPVVLEVSPNVRNLVNLAQTRNPTNSRVMARFSEKLDPQTVTTSTVFLTHVDFPFEVLAVTPVLTPAGDTIELIPQQPLILDKTYDLTVTTGLRDLQGQSLAQGFSYRFATVSDPDFSAPVIQFVSPPAGLQGAPLNTVVKVRFDEPVNPVTVRESTVRLLRNGQPLPMSARMMSNGLDVLTLVPLEYLAAGTVYTVEINGVQDAAGNAVTPMTWTFATSDRVDTIAPQRMPFPLPQGNAVGTNSQVVMRFDEPIDQTGVSSRMLLDESGQAVAGVASFSADGKTLRFTPDKQLLPGADYDVRIELNDLTNRNSGSGSHFFTTGPGPDLQPPSVVSSDPPSGAVNVSPLAPISIEMSEYIDPLSVSEQTVQVLDGATPQPIRAELHHDARTIKIYPLAGLPRGRNLTVSIQGVADTSSNPITAPYQFSFMTKAALDFAPPTYITNAKWPVGVPRDVAVKIVFDEAIDPASVNSNTVYFQTLADVNHPAIPTLDAAQRTIAATAASPLAANTPYRIVLDGVTDLYGNPATEGALAIGGIETGADLTDTGPPTVAAFQPADGSVNVPVNTVVNVIFSEPFDPFSYSGELFEVRDPGGNVIATRREGDPPMDLAASTTFTIHTKPARDFAGNLLVEHVGTFTTSAGIVDTTPPQVVSQTPAVNQFNVSPDVVISVEFDEAVLASLLLFRQSNPGAELEAAMTLSADSKRLTIEPAQPLLVGSWYSIYISLTDLAGNRLSTPGIGGPFAFSFGVGTGALTAERSAHRLRVVHVNPPAGAVGVAGGAVTVSLSTPLDPGALDQVFLSAGGEQVLEAPAAVTSDGLTVEFELPTRRSEAEAAVHLGADALGLQGEMAAPFESRFELAEEPSPHLAWTRPPMGARGVASDAVVYISFTAPLEPLSVPGSVQVLADDLVVTGSLALDEQGRRIMFRPDLPFRAGAAIRVVVDQWMLRTIEGATIAEWRHELRFNVAGPGDLIEAPEVPFVMAEVQVAPADGASGVPDDAVATVSWNGPVEAGRQLRLRVARSGDPVACRLTSRPLAEGGAATLTPHQPLEPGATYELTGVGGVVLSTFTIATTPAK